MLHGIIIIEYQSVSVLSSKLVMRRSGFGKDPPPAERCMRAINSHDGNLIEEYRISSSLTYRVLCRKKEGPDEVWSSERLVGGHCTVL